MAISIAWATQIITVPRLDMLLVQASPEIRELDLDAFRLELKGLEASVEGMPELDTHSHDPPRTIAGVTLSRVVEIINGYTVTFEDAQYAVNLVGANSNVSDVANVNQVSIRSANSAGLTDLPQVVVLRKLMLNRLETDPVTGIMTVYDDDDTTVLFTSQLYEDILAIQTYRGRGSERREQLT